MPRLPDTYAARPIPQSARPIVAFDGTQVARAVQGIGATVQDIGVRYDREQDANAVFEARRKLDDWERTAIFDPKEGAINKRGKDAFGIGESIGKSFDEVQGQIAGSLSNDRQRRAFQEVAASRKSQALNWASRHELQQKDAYEVGQFEADIQSTRDRAALFPDQAAGEMAIQRQRILGFMRGKGASEEAINAALTKAASDTHSAVIGSMLASGRVDDAEKYLQANEAGMGADALLRARGAMKEVVARSKAQNFGDDVMARGLTVGDALKEAREKFTGAEEVAAVQEVKTRFAEAEAVRAQGQKQAADEAWKIITNGGSRKQIKPDLWNSLSGDEQRQINDYTEAKWRRAKADAEGTGNDLTPERAKAFVGLMDMATQEPGKFADLDITKYQPYLTKQHFDRLLTMRAGINKADAKAQDVAKFTSNTMTLLNQTIASAGIKMSGDRSKKQIEQADLFKTRLFEELQAVADSGERLDPTKAREIGLRLLREGIEQGSGWWGFGQTKKRGFEMDPEKTYISKRFADIPKETRAALARELDRPRNAYGDAILRPGDEESIERAYQRGVEQGRFK